MLAVHCKNQALHKPSLVTHPAGQTIGLNLTFVTDNTVDLWGSLSLSNVATSWETLKIFVTFLHLMRPPCSLLLADLTSCASHHKSGTTCLQLLTH